MTRRTLTAAVALFVAGLATAAPVPKDLKPRPVEHDGGSYRVTFPGKPAVAAEETGTDAQGDYTKTGASWNSADDTFAVGLIVRESETNFDTAFDADTLADYFRANAKRLGTVEEERVTAVRSDVVAYWFTIKMEDGGYTRSLAFARGHRIYALVACGADAATVTGKDAKAFFDSFVLTK